MKDDVIVHAHMTEDGEYEGNYFAMGFHARTFEELCSTAKDYFEGTIKVLGEKAVAYGAKIKILYDVE